MALTIAIMQPYFVPYLGYFRLFQHVDQFVIYDCVQFPRRGYVHRNQVPDSQGNSRWLTLPLTKCDQKTSISDLQWRGQDQEAFVIQIRQLAKHWNIEWTDERHRWMDCLCDFSGSVVDYLERTLAFVCHSVGVIRPIVRSSTLLLSPELKGQDRILAICERLGATNYVNSPSGRDLYETDAFAAAGMRLHFLPDYNGSYWSVSYRLLTETPTQLRTELLQPGNSLATKLQNPEKRD